MTGEAIESYKRKERALITPKQMASNLVKRFWMKNKNGQDSYKTAIVNASVALDEIIKEVPMYIGDLNPRWAYWQEVKKELNEL